MLSSIQRVVVCMLVSWLGLGIGLVFAKLTGITQVSWWLVTLPFWFLPVFWVCAIIGLIMFAVVLDLDDSE